MAEYTVYLCTDRGRRLMPLKILSLTAAKALNKTAPFSTLLRPPSDIRTLRDYNYIQNNIKRDMQVQVWRKARGPARLWEAYLVLKWGWAQDPTGGEVFSLAGYDMKHVLTRRIIAAYAEETESSKTDYADDMMKEIVAESMLDTADPAPDAYTRAWGDLSVANDTSKAPSIEMAFAWKKLLTLSGRGVLPRIAEASRSEGTKLYFGIRPHTISSNAVTWQFYTFTEALHDLTSGSKKVIFDAATGDLEDWSLTYDYSEAANYIWGTGQGEANARKVEQKYDAARYKASYWALSEDVLDAKNTADDALAAETEARLIKRRPRISMTGTPISKTGKSFGRHFFVGDKVLVKAKGQQFDAIIPGAIVQLKEDGATKEVLRMELYEE